MSTAISRDGAPLPPYEPVPTGGGDLPLPPEVFAARISVAIALRHQGLTNEEIGNVFSVKKCTVQGWFRRARREGQLAEDINQLLDKDTVFRALETLNEHIDNGSLEASLAVMKGRGHFRNYNNNNAEGGNQVTGIQIVYTTPSGAPPPQLTDVAILPGQIVGTPRSDPAPKAAE